MHAWDCYMGALKIVQSETAERVACLSAKHGQKSIYNPPNNSIIALKKDGVTVLNNTTTIQIPDVPLILCVWGQRIICFSFGWIACFKQTWRREWRCTKHSFNRFFHEKRNLYFNCLSRICIRTLKNEPKKVYLNMRTGSLRKTIPKIAWKVSNRSLSSVYCSTSIGTI